MTSKPTCTKCNDVFNCQIWVGNLLRFPSTMWPTISIYKISTSYHISLFIADVTQLLNECNNYCMPFCLKWIQYFDSVLLCAYRAMYYGDIILIFDETAKFYAKYVVFMIMPSGSGVLIRIKNQIPKSVWCWLVQRKISRKQDRSAFKCILKLTDQVITQGFCNHLC